MICNKSSSDNSLGMKLLGSSKTAPPLPAPVCATSLVFIATIVIKLLVFKGSGLEQTLEREMGSGQVKMSQALLFF